MNSIVIFFIPKFKLLEHGISVEITNGPECVSDKSVNFEAEASFFAGQSVYWYKIIKNYI